jgi:hypothetical protein
MKNTKIKRITMKRTNNNVVLSTAAQWRIIKNIFDFLTIYINVAGLYFILEHYIGNYSNDFSDVFVSTVIVYVITAISKLLVNNKTQGRVTDDQINKMIYELSSAIGEVGADIKKKSEKKYMETQAKIELVESESPIEGYTRRLVSINWFVPETGMSPSQQWIAFDFEVGANEDPNKKIQNVVQEFFKPLAVDLDKVILHEDTLSEEPDRKDNNE